ncbi:MAG: hypothetical protein ACLFUJ_08595 [Phycisphaerae bacterium]
MKRILTIALLTLSLGALLVAGCNGDNDMSTQDNHLHSTPEPIGPTDSGWADMYYDVRE